MSAIGRSRRRQPRAGYTVVELMMAMVVFAIGVLGIIALQKLTAVSNAHARNVGLAQHIARAWASELLLDATTWSSTGVASTTWLGPAITAGAWSRPAYNTQQQFGAAFDALGNPLSDASLSQARFCANIRLAWLTPEVGPVSGNGMLRAEVRVYWLRDGEAPLGSAGLCPVATIAKLGLSSDVYHFVYQTTGLRQHAS